MSKIQLLQRVVFVLVAILGAAPVSLIADDRPDSSTRMVQLEGYRGERGYDLEGVVVAVNPNGDDFVLRSRGRQVRVDARGGVVAWYQGRRYRIRDLERGDRIVVDLATSRSRYPRARSVEVIESVSRRGYGRNQDRDGRYGQGRFDFVGGSIVSFNSRRDLIQLRTDSGRDISVDTRRLRNEWTQGLRGGDWVEFQGYYSGRVFVADSVSNRRDRDRGRDRRDRDRGRDDDWRDGRGW